MSTTVKSSVLLFNVIASVDISLTSLKFIPRFFFLHPWEIKPRLEGKKQTCWGWGSIERKCFNINTGSPLIYKYSKLWHVNSLSQDHFYWIESGNKKTYDIGLNHVSFLIFCLSFYSCRRNSHSWSCTSWSSHWDHASQQHQSTISAFVRREHTFWHHWGKNDEIFYEK